MAVYPAGNPGVAPVDFASDVGAFRALVGDIQYTAYDPAETGKGNFTYFSDAEIEQYLTQGGDDINQAAGWAYLSLAGQAALASASIQDFDLKVDTTKRAAELRALAEFYFGAADAGSEDAFIITRTGNPCYCCNPPYGELAGCFCGDCEYC